MLKLLIVFGVCLVIQSSALRLIGIGCQKCGTSSLSDYLERTSWAIQGLKKELHFFDRRAVNVAVSVTASVHKEKPVLSRLKKDYYSKWSSPEAVQGVPYEITPAYMNDRRTASVMSTVLADDMEQIRIMVVLRNPLKRAFSGMFQVTRKGSAKNFLSMIEDEVSILQQCYNTSMNLKDECLSGDMQYIKLDNCRRALAEETGDTRPWFQRFVENLDVSERKSFPEAWKYEGIVLRGSYADQIRSFLCAGFKPQQFFIVTSQQLRFDQMQVLEQLSSFLNVENTFKSEAAKKEVEEGIFRNSKSSGTIADAAYERLKQFYDPFNKDLYELLTQGGFHVNATALQEELNL